MRDAASEPSPEAHATVYPARVGRPLRITYLITDLKIGGVPLHLYRLVTRLPADQVRARVVSLAGEGPVGTMLRRAGVPVLGCGAARVTDIAALGRLWAILRHDPPDILHALLFHANTAARVIGPLAGVPIRRIITEIQTVEIERPWHLVVDNLTCRLSRCEVANSPSVLEHLHRVAHVPRERLALQWGAVDVEAIASAEPLSRGQLGVPADVPMILWTGRLDPVKGFEEMLAGFARLLRRHRASLVLAGDGGYRFAVERLIAEHGLREHVRLLGQRDDIPRLLRTADLFLFPSRTEGLPNALLEAMAAGLPIVATDVPGCRDCIAHRERGLLVPSDDAEAIAAALAELLTNPQQGRHMGAAARAWVEANAGIANLGARWVDFYRQLIAE